MPELPEVETIRRGLAEHLTGARIASVDGMGGRLVRNNPQGVTDIVAAVEGAVVSGVERRGKFMWITFVGSDFALVVHLGMSGQARVYHRPSRELARHEHLRLTIEGGGAVSFIDPRMFGQLTVSPLVEDDYGRLVPEVAQALAPDPFEDVSDSVFVDRLSRTSRPIKTALLDQRVISGIGNIYADEALYAARVHALRAGSSLRRKKLGEVVEAARDVMGSALAKGGTSFDSLYVNAVGDPGYFARSLQVYGRTGRPCPRCGAKIRKIVVGGRSTHFCPNCQRRRVGGAPRS